MSKKKNKLSAAFTNDIIASKLYRDSINLRIRGAWRDAADLLVKCAEVYMHIKMVVEAACFYTEAAESYMHVDKGEALLAYQKAIKIYCDVGRFDIGGKLEQQVGYINLYAQHWEDAALHFRKAANFLSGDKLLDQSDHCLEKSAECLIRIGEYKEASHLYQLVAKSCVNSNLRRFNSLDHLLMSILCLMAVPEVPKQPDIQALKTPPKNKGKSANGSVAGTDVSEPETYAPLYQTKYEALYSVNEQFEKIDFLWRRSKEKLFVRNIIKARSELDLHSLADHLYYWSNIRPLGASRTALLQIPVQEIQKLQSEAAKAEADKIAKEEAAAKKRALKKAKKEDPSAYSIESESVRSSYQDNRNSVGSAGPAGAPAGAYDARDSITVDNTKANARSSIEMQDGGRSSLQQDGGRSSINSNDRGSVNMGRSSVTK